MTNYNIKLNQNFQDKSASEIFIEFKENEENISLLIENKELFNTIEIDMSMFSEGNLIAEYCYEDIDSFLYNIGFQYNDEMDLYVLENIYFELKEFKDFCELLKDEIEKVVNKVVKENDYKE